MALPNTQRAFSDQLSSLAERKLLRLHWVVINSLGLAPEDILHASIDPKVFHVVASRIGSAFTRLRKDATISIQANTSEFELLSRLSRLPSGNRLVIYNDEVDLPEMSLRSFDLATACFFDQEAAKVVRIFDGHPRRLNDYLHIEMSEHSDASLTLQATRIASLR